MDVVKIVQEAGGGGLLFKGSINGGK